MLRWFVMTNSPSNKPVILTDLDDTLFQTKRKMQQEWHTTPQHIAALDRSLTPRSFMTEEQFLFVQWLLNYADVIPVTARGTQEIKRVKIPFNSWAITTHGAVILDAMGNHDPVWQQMILQAINPFSQRLINLQQQIEHMMEKQKLNAWVRINYEYDNVPIYFVMKHRDSNQISELYQFADLLETQLDSDGFYIHRNGNNIAWIPQPIEKGKACKWLIGKLKNERGIFPILGMGDSLSDFSFMQLCHWFCIPQKSQFCETIKQAIFEK